MRKYSKHTWAWAALLLVGLIPMIVTATPNPNSAAIYERVFNDCPISTLTTTNNYPLMVAFQDEFTACAGFANLHVWRFSEDGIEGAVFNNDNGFSFCVVLTITGTSEGEAGIQISPWWSQLVDGRLNVRTTDGEIACFGGRLPFYSFTSSNGVVYEKGNAISLRMVYLPHELDEDGPATITYELIYDGMSYSSGPLPFDMGNPAEGYGQYGMLDDGRVGGFIQAFIPPPENPVGYIRAEFTQICFENLDTVPTADSTWGGVKALYR